MYGTLMCGWVNVGGAGEWARAHTHRFAIVSSMNWVLRNVVEKDVYNNALAIYMIISKHVTWHTLLMLACVCICVWWACELVCVCGLWLNRICTQMFGLFSVVVQCIMLQMNWEVNIMYDANDYVHMCDALQMRIRGARVRSIAWPRSQPHI